MVRLLFVAGFVAMLAACSGDTEFYGITDSAVGRGFQAVVDDVVALNQEAGASRPYLVGPKDDSWFDANRYFDVLPHLSLRGSTVLDYVYRFNGNGRPYLYGRPDSVDPIGTYEEYVMYVTSAPESSPYCGFLDQVQVDDSEAGYFEVVVLKLLGGQFYLAWHDLYNDTRVVCCAREIECLLEDNGLRDVEAEARQLNLSVRFRHEGELAYVSLVTFTKWGGFYRREFSVTRSAPVQVQQVGSTCLLEYDCGWVF